MASFSTISGDIIREIGWHLVHDKRSLCALALTCRSLNKLIGALIFYNIGVWVQGGRPASTERFRKLMQTLESQPDLGASTRTLLLIWSRDRQEHQIDRDAANRRAETLLSYTPNIRSLKIQNDSSKCSPFILSPEFLRSFTFLRVMTLSDPKLTVFGMTQFMQVSRLRTLSVKNMCYQTLPNARSPLFLADLSEAPHMRNLRLPGKPHMNPSMFSYLLRTTPNLESLSANLPGLQPAKRPMSRSAERELRMFETLSPANILLCLTPIQETLVDLTLWDRGVQWPSHDGSKLDISGFKCLKKLSLCAVCMFTPGGSWENRNGAFNLLPRSIENIDIDFDISEGFLYPSSDVYSLFEDHSDKRSILETIPPERYHWLTELVDHAEMFPKFRSLRITERLVQPPAFLWFNLEWEPPKRLKNNIEHLNWDVRALVRIPRDRFVFA